ncbi:iron-containing alcohol dehydrogenase [Streptomyces violaceusniger]|uniref:Alcohol dehydrogenase iron-type/glycerol dehydrogenase GldA domain-containing protein n=1 Tax=Streptomyces violaceusniger TaxID=68280 RepID=A0A4D4L2F0_STRVO|nr:hypothetical protein SVIO_028420 [Streptomyces violaceusniger]
MRFVHETLPQRVVFAPGDAAAAIGDETARLGAERIMVVIAPSSSPLTGPLTGALPVAHVHHEVVRHVPVEVADRARDAAVRCRADALVSIGGGSATGLAKAVALTTGLPIVAVPTTYAGSEATNVWGVTRGATKTTGVEPTVLPRAIVYDASLLRTLPVELSVTSGLNALAHGVDAMWGPTPTRSTSPWPRSRSAAFVRDCPPSQPTRADWLATSRRCTAPTSRLWPSPRPARARTTRCAMSSAVCSTFPTHRPTPSSFPMCWR